MPWMFVDIVVDVIELSHHEYLIRLRKEYVVKIPCPIHDHCLGRLHGSHG